MTGNRIYVSFFGAGTSNIVAIIRGYLVRKAEFHCGRIVKICISLLGLFPLRNVLSGLTPKVPGVGSRKYVDKLILKCCTSTSAVETSSFIDSFTDYF